MAINETIFNSLIYGGVDSADYGIYISGEGVYNAPRRSVEMVSVPGRNGAVAIDQGHFENIQVTYPCGTFGDDQQDFRVRLGRFRNAILGLRGYQRLTDTYHPDEYRMGLFAEAIEVSPFNSKAGQFEITFDCKPQRFLTAGEDVISYSVSPAMVPNPTPFPSNPMLEVYGYGTINLGDYEIELNGGLIGAVNILSGSWVYYSDDPWEFDYSSLPINVGDTITIESLDVRNTVVTLGSLEFSTIDSQSVLQSYLSSKCDFGKVTLSAFTSETQTETDSHSCVLSNNVSFSTTLTATVSNSSAGKITITPTFTFSDDVSSYVRLGDSGTRMWISDINADSTKSTIGTPTYIDCDIGEAYLIDGNGNVVSLNNMIQFGSDLPQLSPSSTNLTFDNTVTRIDIVPRWWRL